MPLRAGRSRILTQPKRHTMATAADPSAETGAAAPPTDKQWFALDGDAVAGELGVDARAGLSSTDAPSRLERYGPNAFVVAAGGPR
jgi:Cation transporter/ATPase, N-terminus